MSIRFEDLISNHEEANAQRDSITGATGSAVSFVPTEIYPHSRGKGFGVYGHLKDDDTQWGFVNVFANQLTLSNGVTTMTIIEDYISDNEAMPAVMSSKDGQLKLAKGLRFK